MDSEFVANRIGISFVITVFSYLFIPVCIVLLEKKYEIKKLKKINTLNCILVWSIFRIIEIASGNTPSSGTAVFLWGAVSYWILKKNCLKESPKSTVPIEDEPQVKSQQTQASTLTANKSVKYCSRCGKPIDSTTKKCHGCGKQYFRGIPWKKVFAVFLVLLLIGSLVLNVVFYIACKEIVSENTELTSENEELTKKASKIQKEKENLEKELKSSYRQFDEINELVVFVEDDGTRLYHRFLCEKFKGESFWAFNIDAAEGKGYKPCTLCYRSNESQALTWTEEYNKALIKHIVGEDLEIGAAELKQLPNSELVKLMTHDTAIICSSWQGLYHNVYCERLKGICKVDIISVVEGAGLHPCPACLN